MKFEYKTLGVIAHMDLRITAEQIKKLGEEGWEAVCLVTPVTLLFKRAIEEAEAPKNRGGRPPKVRVEEPVAA